MAHDAPPDDFVRAQGLAFMAHQLRRISDRMVADAGGFEREIGICAPPRTASTMLLLRQGGPQSVTQIADTLRQSHPLIINWLGQLEKLGFVSRSADPADARRTVVALTSAGHIEAERMHEASERIGKAYEQLLAEADAPVHDALWRVHDLLAGGRLAELLRASPSEAR